MGNKATSSTQKLLAPRINSYIDNTDEASSFGKSSDSNISSREEDIQSGTTRESDSAAVKSLLTSQREETSLERKQRRDAKTSISALETELGLIVAA